MFLDRDSNYFAHGQTTANHCKIISTLALKFYSTVRGLDLLQSARHSLCRCDCVERTSCHGLHFTQAYSLTSSTTSIDYFQLLPGDVVVKLLAGLEVELATPPARPASLLQ